MYQLPYSLVVGLIGISKGLTGIGLLDQKVKKKKGKKKSRGEKLDLIPLLDLVSPAWSYTSPSISHLWFCLLNLNVNLFTRCLNYDKLISLYAKERDEG